MNKYLDNLPSIMENSSLEDLKYSEKMKKKTLSKIYNKDYKKRSSFQLYLNRSLSFGVLTMLIFLVFYIVELNSNNSDLVQGENHGSQMVFYGANSVKEEFDEFIIPSYLPNGYTEKETRGVYLSLSDSDRHFFASKYCYKESCIFIEQMKPATPPPSGEFSNDEIIEINGYKAYIRKEPNKNEIVLWRNKNLLSVFSTDKEITVTKLKKIVQSLQWE